MPVNIYANVKTLVEQHAMSIEELENKLHMRSGFIEEWQHTVPAEKYVAQIAAYFDVEMHDVEGYRSMYDYCKLHYDFKSFKGISFSHSIAERGDYFSAEDIERRLRFFENLAHTKFKRV